jgi:hypothetical protein
VVKWDIARESVQSSIRIWMRDSIREVEEVGVIHMTMMRSVAMIERLARSV